MKFMLLTFESPDAFGARGNEGQQQYWGAWRAYSEALREAGVLSGGAALEPPLTAATVRTGDGKRRVQDGPYVDSKDQLGGFYIIDVDSLDRALEWAARCPAASDGAVEVRPLVPLE